MPLPKQDEYTIYDIYSLSEGERAELIDGMIYNMAPPNRIHQEIISQLTKVIGQYIDNNKGQCKIYPAPFAVFLNDDDRNYVEPDISVICDKNKLDDKGCNGAPDWVIEVVSPSTKRVDYGIKLFKYRTAGVREYWIINPLTNTVNVFDLEKNEKSDQYTFQDDIAACIFEDLIINISELIKD
ncbi:MAG: Uma2 family endonuclease [Lachnospiraceae bacterium]|nr:Uma2 family endonuclease [Lachnospiraceae bacterium]